MRILPLSVQLIRKRNPDKTSNNNTIPIVNNGLQKDTVSFSGNILQDSLDNLNETINTKIQPFIDDSKQTYQKLININNDINNVMGEFSKAELKLLVEKNNYSDPLHNEDLIPYQTFVERAIFYNENLISYKKLKKTLSSENYYSDAMGELLKDGDTVIYKSNPEIEKIVKVFDKYHETLINISSSNDSHTLRSENKPLYDKILDLNNKYSYGVKASLFSIPLPDALKLIQDTQKVNKELKKPTQSLMKTLTTIEHLQQSADSIVGNIGNYENNKDKINTFIADYQKKKEDLPSADEINDAYAKISEICEASVKKHVSELDAYYDKEFVQKGINIDIDSVDELLKEQEDVVKPCLLKMKAIRQKQIEENNREVLKRMGYDPSELYD